MKVQIWKKHEFDAANNPPEFVTVQSIIHELHLQTVLLPQTFIWSARPPHQHLKLFKHKSLHPVPDSPDHQHCALAAISFLDNTWIQSLALGTRCEKYFVSIRNLDHKLRQDFG